MFLWKQFVYLVKKCYLRPCSTWTQNQKTPAKNDNKHQTCYIFICIKILQRILQWTLPSPWTNATANSPWPGPNFIELLSTKYCLAWNVCLAKNWITNQISMWFPGKANNRWIPVTSNLKQLEIWLVILFLTRKKFHAEQIVVLSSSVKLGTGPSFIKPVSIKLAKQIQIVRNSYWLPDKNH